MRITVDLRRDEYDRLQRLALAERRPLRDQAAVIIAERLEARPAPERKTAAPAGAATT
jgi:hypothetical protein